MLAKNTPKLLSVAVIALALSSCSRGAMVENMSVGPMAGADFGKYSHNIRIVSAQNNTRWERRVSDENFSEALKDSLYANNLLNEDNPKYELSASIVELTPPSKEFNIYVTSDVQYVLRDVKNGEVVVDKTIESRESASPNDRSMPSARVRFVDEHVINDNITQFVNYLRR